MKKQHLKSRHHLRKGDVFKFGSKTAAIVESSKKRTIWQRSDKNRMYCFWGRKSKYMLYYIALKKGAKIQQTEI